MTDTRDVERLVRGLVGWLDRKGYPRDSRICQDGTDAERAARERAETEAARQRETLHRIYLEWPHFASETPTSDGEKVQCQHAEWAAGALYGRGKTRVEPEKDTTHDR